MKKLLLLFICLAALKISVAQTLVDSQYVNFLQYYNYTYKNLNPNSCYFLQVSGVWSNGCYVSYCRDAAYQVTDSYGNQNNPPTELSNIYGTNCQDRWVLNGVCAPRPTPNVYRPDHIYIYPLPPGSDSATVSFYDAPYGDNSGSLIFKLYQSDSIVIPSVTITTSQSNICAGSAATFSAVPVNGGGSPVYHWRINGVTIGTDSGSIFIDSTLKNNDTITCKMISNSPCAGSPSAISDTIVMSIAAGVIASINIGASDTNICYGTPVTFYSLIQNGGTTPVYQWQINGLNKGTNAASYTTDSLKNNDVVSCQLISNAGCVNNSPLLSNPVTIVVTNKDVAGIITAIRDTICEGTPASLSLSGYNGNPIQWQYYSSPDFVNISTAVDSFYQSVPLQSTVYRVIVGTGRCADTSGNFTLIVQPSPLAYFTDSVSGWRVMFNSAGSAGNITSYSWNFGDGTSTTLTNPVHTFNNADTFYVCLTVYNSSNCSYTLCENVNLFNPTGVEEVRSKEVMDIYPNPFDDKIFISFSSNSIRQIKAVELYDEVGKVRIRKNVSVENQIPFWLDGSSLSGGIYILRIITNETAYISKVIKK